MYIVQAEHEKGHGSRTAVPRPYKASAPSKCRGSGTAKQLKSAYYNSTIYIYEEFRLLKGSILLIR
jgi:hypothetical protein